MNVVQDIANNACWHHKLLKAYRITIVDKLYCIKLQYSRTPDERPPSPTTTFSVTDSGFCSYTNPSRATIPLIRPHQCDSEGGRIRGVLL